MTRRNLCEQFCTCHECAELDLAFPGEGRQLTFPLLIAPKPRRRRSAPAALPFRHHGAVA